MGKGISRCLGICHTPFTSAVYHARCCIFKSRTFALIRNCNLSGTRLQTQCFTTCVRCIYSSFCVCQTFDIWAHVGNTLMRATLVLCLCKLGLVTRTTTSRLSSKVDHGPCSALSVSLLSRACKWIPEPLVRGFPDRGKPGRRDRNDRDSHVTSNTSRRPIAFVAVPAA